MGSGSWSRRQSRPMTPRRDDIATQLANVGYIADNDLAMALVLMEM